MPPKQQFKDRIEQHLRQMGMRKLSQPPSFIFGQNQVMHPWVGVDFGDGRPIATRINSMEQMQDAFHQTIDTLMAHRVISESTHGNYEATLLPKLEERFVPYLDLSHPQKFALSYTLPSRMDNDHAQGTLSIIELDHSEYLGGIMPKSLEPKL